MAAAIKPIKEMHSEEVKTRLKPNDYAYMKSVADQMGMPIGVLVRHAVLTHLRGMKEEKHTQLAN